jgi:carbonic anhydrase/acetyltransferase-like protein (isoleucine patch superfamily)
MIYAFDGRKPEIGKGVYINDHAIVIGDVKIGDGCYVGPGVILRGDYGRIEIGAETAVEEGVVIHAPPDRICRIGERVTLGHGAIIHSSNIDSLAVIGMGAVLSLGSKVGEWAIVAEGAVVTFRQNVQAGVVVAGNPARVLREVTTKDKETWEKGKQIYINLAQKCLKIWFQRVDRA